MTKYQTNTEKQDSEAEKTRQIETQIAAAFAGRLVAELLECSFDIDRQPDKVMVHFHDMRHAMGMAGFDV